MGKITDTEKYGHRYNLHFKILDTEKFIDFTRFKFKISTEFWTLVYTKQLANDTYLLESIQIFSKILKCKIMV